MHNNALLPIKNVSPDFFFSVFLFYEPKVIKFKIALCKFFQLRPLSQRTCYEQDPVILFPLERAHKVSVSSKETVWWNQPHNLISPIPSFLLLLLLFESCSWLGSVLHLVRRTRSSSAGHEQYGTAGEGGSAFTAPDCTPPAAPTAAAPSWTPDPALPNLCPPPNNLLLHPSSCFLHPTFCIPHLASHSPSRHWGKGELKQAGGKGRAVLPPLLHNTMESFM